MTRAVGSLWGRPEQLFGWQGLRFLLRCLLLFWSDVKIGLLQTVSSMILYQIMWLKDVVTWQLSVTSQTGSYHRRKQLLINRRKQLLQVWIHRHNGRQVQCNSNKHHMLDSHYRHGRGYGTWFRSLPSTVSPLLGWCLGWLSIFLSQHLFTSFQFSSYVYVVKTAISLCCTHQEESTKRTEL